MWLYVPSTPSPCAPEAAGSTGPLSWQSQLLAQSCVWRGKHSPSLIWSRRCETVSWLRRLSTVMCEPSLADASVAAWMASSGVFPASPTASPESASGATTSAICGDRLAVSSPSPAPGSSGSKTSAGCSPKAARSGYEETFSAWAARLRAASSARRKSALARSASASSSSAWPTPRASEAGPDFAMADRSTTGMALPALAATWPTPVVGDGNGAKGYLSHGSVKLSLHGLAVTGGMPTTGLWPSPMARDTKGVDRTELRSKNTRPLNEAVAHWNTPRASDGEKGGPGQRFTDGGGMPLVAQAVTWATPSVAMVTGGQTSRSGDRRDELLLNGQAAGLSSSLGQPIMLAGLLSPNTTLSAYLRSRAMTCSTLRSETRALARMGARSRGKKWAHEGPIRPFVRPAFRKQLNPLFVGDLMGWPPGLTSFACSATASLIWRERMRSALWRLSLPEGPPAQLSLFG